LFSFFWNGDGTGLCIILNWNFLKFK
jgi:hypothetical protein